MSSHNKKCCAIPIAVKQSTIVSRTGDKPANQNCKCLTGSSLGVLSCSNGFSFPLDEDISRYSIPTKYDTCSISLSMRDIVVARQYPVRAVL